MEQSQTLTAIGVETFERIQRQIARLTGAPFRLVPLPPASTTIRSLCRDLGGRQVLGHLALHGFCNGEAVLLVARKDVIRLCSTMVMLPEAEIADAVERETFDDDIAQAFAELVNLIAAQIARSFSGAGGGACQLKYTGQALIAADEFGALGDDHLPDRQFQLLAADLVHGDERLGRLCVLVPPGIPSLTTPSGAAEASRLAGEEAAAADRPVRGTNPATRPGTGAEPIRPVNVWFEPIIARACDRLTDELAALIGETVLCSCSKAGVVDLADRSDFGDSPDPLAFSCGIVFKNGEKTATFLLDRPAAIRLGGMLNLYDEKRLEDAVAADHFTVDIQDGCAETLHVVLAGVISSLASATPEPLSFTGPRLDPAGSPQRSTAGRAASDDPVLFVSFDITFGDGGRVRLLLLLPPELAAILPAGAEPEKTASALFLADGAAPVNEKQGGEDYQAEPGRVLIVRQNGTDDGAVTAALHSERIGWTSCACRDDIKGHVLDDHRALILIFEELDERAFATVIKASSCSSLPIIVAAGNWTESKVMAAVRYGASDIIVLPAGEQEVREKVRGMLRKNAA